MEIKLSTFSFVTLLQAAFAIIPVLWIAFHKKKYQYLRIIPILCGLFVLEQSLPLFFRSSPFYWHWFVKTLEILWPLLLVYLLKWKTPKEVGYTLPIKKSSWLWAIGLGLLSGIVSLLSDGFPPPNEELVNFQMTYPLIETILFQLSMPGIAEELVYRGIFLAIFNKCFGKPWKLLNVRIGPGLFLTTLLFTVIHVINFQFSTNKILWNFAAVIPVFIAGLLLGWLREKTESIWPCVVLHNLANSFCVITLFIYART